MEEDIERLFIKEFGLEKTQEFKDALETAESISDEKAKTIIEFLLEQNSMMIKEFKNHDTNFTIFNFLYYLFIGTYFIFSETFKPIYILFLISPYLIPMFFIIFNNLRKKDD